MTPPSRDTTDLTPRHLRREEFGDRLHKLMHAKGWHQSELARRAGLNRDAVSTYVRGKAFPTQINLEALAKALGVDKDVLLPNRIETAIEREAPAFEVRESAVRPGVSWLRVNRLVRTATAMKIGAILAEEDEAAD